MLKVRVYSLGLRDWEGKQILQHAKKIDYHNAEIIGVFLSQC